MTSGFNYSMLPHNISTPLIETSPAKAWGFSFLFVTLINIMSANGVFLRGCMKHKSFQIILLCMISFAIGVLSANGIMVLIPEGLGLENITEVYLYRLLVILVGLYSFSLVETIIKLVAIAKRIKHNGYVLPDQLTDFDGHNHFHDCTSKPQSRLPSNEPRRTISLGCMKRDTTEEEPQIFETNTNSEKESLPKKFYSPIFCYPSVPAYATLIIFGDAIHNFIDGLAIGSSFSFSINMGLNTAIAVLCEELPHELGDFAALINAGFSVFQALFWNLVSSATCYLGLIIGLLLGPDEKISHLISLYCGGIFVYISFIGLLPEVLEEAYRLAKKSFRRYIFNLFLIYLFIAIGVCFMIGMSHVKINIA